MKMTTMLLREDLPIKYYLGLHGEDSMRDKYYPIFEISQYLIRVYATKAKDLDMSSFKFSSKSLKYVFGDRIKDETFKEEIVQYLKALLKDELLISKGESIFFTKNALKHFYQIND